MSPTLARASRSASTTARRPPARNIDPETAGTKKGPCIVQGPFGRLAKLRPGATADNGSAGGAEIVGCLLAGAAIGHDFIGYLLTFAQRAEAGALDGADVH